MVKQFNAKDELTKNGWSVGKGLGKSEDGIKEAVKVKLKFDTSGVGHDPGKDLKFHWWDHVFNTAAGNIQVSNSEEGVDVSQVGETVVHNKKGATKFANQELLYGRFVKAATLTNNGELVPHMSEAAQSGNSSSKSSNSDSSSDSDSDPDEDIGTASKLTDEALFKLCGGLTAHKGARHGLRLSGKLQRVAQADLEIKDETPKVEEAPVKINDEPLESSNTTCEFDKSDIRKDKKCKDKKRKREDVECVEESQKKKKQKKKKHESRENVNRDCVNSEKEEDKLIPLKKKKKKKCKKTSNEKTDEKESQNSLHSPQKEDKKAKTKCIDLQTNLDESMSTSQKNPNLPDEEEKSKRKKKNK